MADQRKKEGHRQIPTLSVDVHISLFRLGMWDVKDMRKYPYSEALQLEKARLF